MGLIICASCGRQRNVAKIPRKVHTCSNCGARDPLIVRGGRVSTLVCTTDKEGVDRETARHQTYAGLRKYQEVHNHKPGFVGWKFKELYGTWPNGETGTPAEPMTHELALWLRREKSRFVAQKRKEKKANSTAESEARGGRIAMLERVANLMNHRRSPTS